MKRAVAVAVAGLILSSCGGSDRQTPTTPSLSPGCANLLRSCGVARGLACVSVRYSTVGECRDAACVEPVAAVLRANGVTTSVFGASLGGVPPSSGQPGCVGTRADIDGTVDGALCIAALLGAGYTVAPTGCNASGFPHSVFVR